jgi:hypothetical protein
MALVGQFAQQSPEVRAIGILGPEGACYLARADLTRLRPDEGEQVLL